MKKILSLLFVFALVLCGCSSDDKKSSQEVTNQTKLEEVISKAKDDKEAYQMAIDYFNENVKYMKCTIVRTSTDGKESITGLKDMWLKEDGLWEHSQICNEQFYSEVLYTANNQYSAMCYNNDSQPSTFDKTDSNPYANQKKWFQTEYPNMKVEKTLKDDLTIFKLTYTYDSTDEKGNPIDIPCVAELTFNQDAMIMNKLDYEVDENGKRIEDYDLFENQYSNHNKDVSLNEDEVVAKMKELENKSYKEVKKEWDKILDGNK